MQAYQQGFDEGYAWAVERVTDRTRLAPPEYFWHYDFRFDLRNATRGEQEAIRVLFLAQKIELDGFTARHVELVGLILGHTPVAAAMLEP